MLDCSEQAVHVNVIHRITPHSSNHQMCRVYDPTWHHFFRWLALASVTKGELLAKQYYLVIYLSVLCRLAKVLFNAFVRLSQMTLGFVQ